MRCRNKALKQGMRPMGFAVEFRMKLAGNKKWVLRQFNDFH
jgi:hypothetical protein